MNKIIYLDAAATYQKSDGVIAAQVDFLRNHYANAARGICARATWVDDMLDNMRGQVASFMTADSRQIVFVPGTTAAMNMIAQMMRLTSNSVVAVSDLDHHSARLPFVATGAKITVCNLDDNFRYDLNAIPFADVFVITAMSNVLGIPQNVEQIIAIAREKNPNVVTVVDAAQYVVHNDIDVKKWDADFVCWSGHKIGADTGVGILYVKNPDRFEPVMWGGGMINKIVDGNIILNNAPDVFEAGTLPLTQISGLGYAIDDIKNNRPDLNLIKYLYDELSNIQNIKILTERDATMITFIVDDMHALDFGALIGAHGVCLRVGNMCASWIHNLLGVPASIRISVGAYNTMDEVKTVVQYIKDMVK